MSATVEKILQFVMLFLGSAVGSAIINGILSGFIKGKIESKIGNKAIKDAAREIMQEMIAEIKTVTFKQNIQPIVNSELEKVTEKVDSHLLKETQEQKGLMLKVIKILEKFIAYFDYSIGVPEKVKEEAKQALAEAQIQDVPVQEDFEVQVVEEPKEEPVKVVENKLKNNPMR